MSCEELDCKCSTDTSVRCSLCPTTGCYRHDMVVLRCGSLEPHELRLFNEEGITFRHVPGAQANPWWPTGLNGPSVGCYACTGCWDD